MPMARKVCKGNLALQALTAHKVCKENLAPEALKGCKKPLRAVSYDRSAAFTMVNCAPTSEESYAVASDAFV